MKIMVSMPMSNLNSVDIQNKLSEIRRKFGDEDQIVSAFLEDDPPLNVLNKGIYFLGESLKFMSECDGVYFVKEWNNAKGCQIEHLAAKNYNMKIFYE